MKKILVLLAALAVALSTLLAPAPAAQAVGSDADRSTSAPATAKKAPTKCTPNSGMRGGYCVTYLSSQKKVVYVESVPLRNRSSKTATMNCSFTSTISKSAEYAASMTSSAEIGAAFGLAKMSLSVTVSKKVTQTATQATAAGGSVVLEPGEEVACIRTYGSVTVRMQEHRWGPSSTSKKIVSIKVPSTLGVDIVD